MKILFVTTMAILMFAISSQAAFITGKAISEAEAKVRISKYSEKVKVLTNEQAQILARGDMNEMVKVIRDVVAKNPKFADSVATKLNTNTKLSDKEMVLALELIANGDSNSNTISQVALLSSAMKIQATIPDGTTALLTIAVQAEISKSSSAKKFLDVLFEKGADSRLTKEEIEDAFNQYKEVNLSNLRAEANKKGKDAQESLAVKDMEKMTLEEFIQKLKECFMS